MRTPKPYNTVISNSLCHSMPQGSHESTNSDSDLPLSLQYEREHVALGTESSTTPLAGPGTTRQTRKLQLRRAGFKGKMVPQRNVTPKSTPSDAWTRRDSSGPLDVELHMSAVEEEIQRPRSSSGTSGILQEIGNSSFRRRKGGRPRIESLSIFQDENMEGSPRTASNDTAGEKEPVSES